ncbi:hypothetical protein ACQJBY_026877 [Aegilops geniculata]
MEAADDLICASGCAQEVGGRSPARHEGEVRRRKIASPTQSLKRQVGPRGDALSVMIPTGGWSERGVRWRNQPEGRAPYPAEPPCLNADAATELRLKPRLTTAKKEASGYEPRINSPPIYPRAGV